MSLSKMYSAARILVLLLCSFVYARGQTSIPITGSATACTGSGDAYTAPRTAGYTYVWSSSAQGNVGVVVNAGTTTSTSVNWLGQGAATVTVKGYNGTTLMETGMLNVSVSRKPDPYLTINKQVGCQNLQADTGAEKGQLPGPSDTALCIRVCEQSAAIFKAHGATSSTYTWTVTGGTVVSTSGNICTIQWGASGAGAVTVTETTASGCTGSQRRCIEIISSPIAKFYALLDSNKENVEACLNQKITFVDTSSAGTGSPLVTWLWDFGDGTTTTHTSNAPVTHSYSAPGNYKVRLRVINQCNCESSFTMNVRVSNYEGVQIACPSVVCEGATVTYQANASCNSYTWSVNGGTILSGQNTPELSVTWDKVGANGVGYVYFDSRDCDAQCTGLTSLKVPVVVSKGSIVGPRVLCTNKAYLFRLPQWPTTVYNWTITPGTGATLSNTDQRNEILLNTNATGTIMLQCTYYNTLLKCGGSAQYVVEVAAPKVITGAKVVCNGTMSIYTANASADWTAVDPSGTIINGPTGATSWSLPFNKAGAYLISIAGNFCPPAPFAVMVKDPPPPPLRIWGPAEACVGVQTKYSGCFPLPETFFTWSSPTGASFSAATGENTLATFSNPVADAIKLVRNWTDLPTSCTSPEVTLTVNRPVRTPKVTGSAIGCPSTYQAYNAGSYQDADNYEWSIYPTTLGSVASGQGKYEIQALWNEVTANTTGWLIVKARKCGNYKTDSFAVTVVVPPALTITSSLGNTLCAKTPATFTLNATPAINYSTAGAVIWDFGDGFTATGGPSQIHTYSNNTTTTGYQIDVVVNNPNGCPEPATAKLNVTVVPAPVAHISPAMDLIFCDPATFNGETLSATIQSGYGSTTGFAWYRNGVQVGTNTPTYFANQTGTYYIEVTNQYGCKAKSNAHNIIQHCTGSPPCYIPSNPTVSVVEQSNVCGAVVLTSTWSAGSIGQSWLSAPSIGQTVLNTTPTSSTVRFNVDTSGIHTFISRVVYPDANGNPCAVDQPYTVLVPYMADLRFSVRCFGPAYIVTLLDHSNYYPGFGPTTFSFYENGSLLASGSSTSFTINNPSTGVHNYSLVIERPGIPACTAYATVNLTPIPGAGGPISFTAGPNPACVIDAAVQFTPVPYDPSWQYLWTFGDSTSNKQAMAARTYAKTRFGGYDVTLRVRNAYGCSAQSAPQNIDVKPDALSGKVLQSPAAPCDGSPATLTYKPDQNSSTALGFAWFNNSFPFPASGNPINVFDPGGYFVKTSDVYGCLFTTDVKPVSFFRIPEPIISGNAHECVNNSFTLNGFVGAGNYTYEWRRNNTVVQTGPGETLEETNLPAGTYTYLLTLSAPNPGGGSCAKTSQPFTLIVHPLPPPPVINPPAVLNCAPYTIELSAVASVPGDLNWSNGMSNTPITVYSGGDYRVSLTDEYGCVNHTDTYVPKDPNSFLWVFPSGCYSLCKQDMPFTLLNPFGFFKAWDWQYGGNSDLSGYGYVSPYAVQSPGFYQLMLQNDICAAYSDTMSVDFDNPNCGGADPCERRSAYKNRVYQDESTNGCNWYVDVAFNNAYGMALPYTVTSSVGWVSPAAGAMPPGTSLRTFQLMLPSGFAGGQVTLTFVYNLGGGQYCSDEVEVSVEACRLKAKKTGPAGSDTAATTALADPLQQPLLSLAPNPAHETVQIGYRTGAGSSSAVEVYDVLGRRVAFRSLPANATDSWNLDVSGYVPGVYRVVLRQDGKVVLHQALSVQR